MRNYCMKCMNPIDEGEVCPKCGKIENVQMDPHFLAEGTILNGRYLVGRPIGQGGFGITYIGRDLKLDMKIAIKEYYPNGYAYRNMSVSPDVTISNTSQRGLIEAGKEKFLREARVVAQFHEEPGIVDVRDFFEANETAYIVMEYLEGQDLRSYIEKNTIDAKTLIQRLKPVIIAMDKIHKKGIIHRDISPDNIMMLKNGMFKLMDFGAARLVDYSDQKSVSVVLKAGYAPEEQYRSKGKQGPWTDIYALCATMYKCITGITLDDSLERGYEDGTKWPSELGIEIPERIEQVMKKGLAVKQKDRYQSVGELAEALYGSSEADNNSLTDIYSNLDSTTIDKDAQTIEVGHRAKKETTAQKLEPDGKIKFVGGNGGTDGTTGTGKNTALETGKKKNMKFAGIAGVVGLCLLLIIGAAALISKGKNKIAYDPETMYHITLTANEKMSVKEFQEATEILKGRLDVFAGKNEYGMEVKEDKIQLYIKKEAFGDNDIEYVLKAYLSRAMNLYLFDEDLGAISLPRSAIKEITIKEGTVKGVDPKEYDITTDTYKYIEIQLTDEFVEEKKDYMVDWDDEIRIGLDMEESSAYYYMPCEITEDRKIIKMFNDDFDGNYFELLKFNFTNQPYSNNLLFEIDLNNMIEWETVEEGQKGSNQCNFGDIKEDSVTILYEQLYEEISDGEWLDIKQAFRKRLDALEQPYALGTYEKKDASNEKIQKYFVVQTTLGHMGRPIMDLLVERYPVELQSGLCSEGIYSFDKLEFEENNNTLTLQLSKYSKDDITDITKIAIESGNGKVSLSVNNIPLISSNVDKVIEDGKITFTDVIFPNEQKINKENAWIARLIEAAGNTEDLMASSFYYDSHFFNAADDDKILDDKSFGYSISAQCDPIKERIQKACPDAKVIDSGYDINVFLDMNVDETLPEEAFKMTEKLYTESEFENSIFNSIGFYLIDEEDDERARIFLKKSYARMDDENGYVSMYGAFQGGRLDKYRDKFEEIITTNEFVARYSGKDDSRWMDTWLLGYTSVDADAKDVNLHVGDSPITRFHISAKVGDETEPISFDVSNHEMKKYKFMSYDWFFDIKDDGNGKATLYMKEEGTGELILHIYTKDYGTLREIMAVSAYTPVENREVTVKNDGSIYRCAQQETDTENSDIKETISAGETVTICGTCKDFYYIRTKDNVSGYIPKDEVNED